MLLRQLLGRRFLTFNLFRLGKVTGDQKGKSGQREGIGQKQEKSHDEIQGKKFGREKNKILRTTLKNAAKKIFR